jgi:large subunit ribosomal protein L6e
VQAKERWLTKRRDPPKQKKEVSKNRVEDQKAIDKALIANIKKVEFLPSYLAASFSLRKGDKPHEMKW